MIEKPLQKLFYDIKNLIYRPFRFISGLPYFKILIIILLLIQIFLLQDIIKSLDLMYYRL